MNKKNITQAKDIGRRLDKIIASYFTQYSRAFIKEQIRLGNFLVNNKKVRPSFILRQGDLVALAPGFSLPEAAAIISNPAIALNIIYENHNVTVIDKPAGLSVHPRADKNGAPLTSELANTLVSGLLAHYPPLIDVGDNPSLRPGLVHRLDKNTSGVMIIAKNQPSFERLKKQFKERKAAKKYLALVHGRLPEKQNVIKTNLLRSKTDPTKQKVSAKEGKEAITQYKVIEEFDKYSLVEAQPKTGRLHQIRVQMAWLGHPVVGDTKYGSSKLPTPTNLTRQFLHAAELKIVLPDGSKKCFTASLPDDLKTTLQTLEKIKKI